MPKPKHPPKISSFALTQAGERSAAISLRLLDALDVQKKHFVIPQNAGELLYWSSETQIFEHLSYIDKNGEKAYHIPSNTRLQLHIFSNGEWCEQIHQCHEMYCRPQLKDSIWKKQESNIVLVCTQEIILLLVDSFVQVFGA